MDEKPIIFNGEMVCALLAGRKTQTRRAITKQSANDAIAVFGPNSLLLTANRDLLPISVGVGDKLWVRENWRIGAWDDDCRFAIDYQADDFKRKEWIEHPDEEWSTNQFISLTEKCLNMGIPQHDGKFVWKDGKCPLPWRPSIHMPRVFSRIKLRVTDIRIQRVANISVEDAIAEGWQVNEKKHPATKWFRELWDGINAGRGYGYYDQNPWVAAYTFEVINNNMSEVTK